MARSFDTGSYVELNSGHLVTSEDWSVSTLIEYDNASAIYYTFLNGDFVGEGGESGFASYRDTSRIIHVAVATSSSEDFTSTGTVADATLVHIGITKIGTACRLYIDGVEDAGSPFTLASATMDYTSNDPKTRIGATNVPSFQLLGKESEFALWTVGLSATEIGILSNRFSPLLVRPASLAGHWSLLGRGSTEPDSLGLNNGVLTGTAFAVHPRVIYPTQVITGFAPAAAPPAGLIIPVAMHEYRQRHQSVV